jgi:carbamate kinase
VVSEDDLAFQSPSKPIGSFYTTEQSKVIYAQHPDWVLVEDAGRGFRRVVPCPQPLEIVEEAAIKLLIEDGNCVIAVGGGGIPVVRDSDGSLRGVDAVIDKDFASSLLAADIKADVLVISTGVPKVYLNYGKANERALDKVVLAELKRYIAEGHFAPGSMLPKIKAVTSFLEKGGREAIITNPESLEEAVAGKTGTHIYP